MPLPPYFRNLPRDEARRVLCIGGPLNRRVATVRGEKLAVPQVLGDFGHVTYLVEYIDNCSERIYFARAEDVPLERVLPLLFGAYAAWHGGSSGERLPLRPERGQSAAVDWKGTAQSLTSADYGGATARQRADKPIDTTRLLQSGGTPNMVTCSSPPAAIDPDAPCNDCKGTRQYMPFTGPVIPCPTCRPAVAQPA